MDVKLEKWEFAPDSEQKPVDGKINTYKSLGQLRTEPFKLLLTFSSSSAKDNDEVKIRIRARDVASQSLTKLIFSNGEATHHMSFENQNIEYNELVFNIFNDQNQVFETFTVNINQPDEG